MKCIDGNGFEDVCIRDIMTISRVRPAGRTVNNLSTGRKSNGLVYIWSGEALFTDSGDETVSVSSGELLFIPKDCRYKMQYTAPSTTFVVVNFEMFDKNGSDVLLSPNISVLAKDDATGQLSGIIAKLEGCGAPTSLSSLFRRKELVYKLLSRVYESSPMLSPQQQRYPQIFAGVRLLEETYLENLPVSKFAQASNISLSLFRQLFGKQYGMSPIAYRNRLRIDRAVAILSEGSCTVAETAYACGFENIGYFCRYYKKITGKTPQQTKLHDL
jgi:AraC-like DNA-binding protein